jgi:uncharacterized protein
MTTTHAVTAAIATGLLGSLHCAAMCGPLAVAGCTKGERVDVWAAAGYFFARTVSYAAVGAVLGQLGEHALCVLPVGAVQGAITAIVAVLAAARGVQLLRRRRGGVALVRLRTRRRSRISEALSFIASLLPRRGAALGAATAVMPCGMLLPAWALAAGTAGATSGAAVMFAFAIATAPGLLVPLAARRVAQGAVARIPVVLHGVAWCALAAYVAARPLLGSVHHH